MPRLALRHRVRLSADQVAEQPSRYHRRHAVLPTIYVLGSRDRPMIATGPGDALAWDPVSSLMDYSIPQFPFVRSLGSPPSVDDRIWTPDPLRPMRSIRGQPSRLAAPRRSRQRGWTVSLARLGFANALHTMVCVRRKRRRQVLFAKGRSGRSRRGRRNRYSNIWCI